MRMRMDIYSYERVCMCSRCIVKIKFHLYIYGRSKMNLIQRCINIYAITFYVHNRINYLKSDGVSRFSSSEFYLWIFEEWIFHQHSATRATSQIPLFILSWHRRKCSRWQMTTDLIRFGAASERGTRCPGPSRASNRHSADFRAPWKRWFRHVNRNTALR